MSQWSCSSWLWWLLSWWQDWISCAIHIRSYSSHIHLAVWSLLCRLSDVEIVSRTAVLRLQNLLMMMKLTAEKSARTFSRTLQRLESDLSSFIRMLRSSDEFWRWLSRFYQCCLKDTEILLFHWWHFRKHH